MSEILKISKPTMQNIANALRSKTGSEDTISPRQMPGVINGLDIESHEEDGIFVGNEYYDDGILDSDGEYHYSGVLSHSNCSYKPYGIIDKDDIVYEFGSIDKNGVVNTGGLLNDNGDYVDHALIGKYSKNGSQIDTWQSGVLDYDGVGHQIGAIGYDDFIEKGILDIDGETYSNGIIDNSGEYHEKGFVNSHGDYYEKGVVSLDYNTRYDYIYPDTTNLDDYSNLYGGPIGVNDAVCKIGYMGQDYSDRLAITIPYSNNILIPCNQKSYQTYAGQNLNKELTCDDGDFQLMSVGTIEIDTSAVEAAFNSFEVNDEFGTEKPYIAGDKKQILESLKTDSYVSNDYYIHNKNTDSPTILSGESSYSTGILDSNNLYHSEGIVYNNGSYSLTGLYGYDPDNYGEHTNYEFVNEWRNCGYITADGEIKKRGVFDTDGYLYSQYGVVGSDGAFSSEGIVDVDGHYYESGIVPASGCERQESGVLGKDSNGYTFFESTGIIDKNGICHNYGFLNANGDYTEYDGGTILVDKNGATAEKGIIDCDGNYHSFGVVSENNYLRYGICCKYNGEDYIWSSGILDEGGNFQEIGVVDINQNYHRTGLVGNYETYTEYFETGAVNDAGDYLDPTTSEGVYGICQMLITKFFNGDSTEFETYVHNVINDN